MYNLLNEKLWGDINKLEVNFIVKIVYSFIYINNYEIRQLSGYREVKSLEEFFVMWEAYGEVVCRSFFGWDFRKIFCQKCKGNYSGR